MSLPIYCKNCAEIIGVESDEIILARASSGKFDFDHNWWNVDCPGRGNHAKPARKEEKKLFGLLKKVTQSYPETWSASHWYEYVGPASKFWLWIAIVLGTKRYPSGNYEGVVINNKWAWWSIRNGFTGDGVDEIKSL